MIRPEHELLLCCGPPSTTTVRRIHELLQRDLDWPHVFRTAGRQGIAPLLHRTLTGVHASGVPPRLYESFAQYVTASGMQSRLLMHRAAQTLRLFEMGGLRALVYKGGSLAKLAYGDVGLRQFSDLDVLVHRHDYDRARDLLLRNGYQQHADYGWETTFKGHARVEVDLHHNLTPAIFPLPLDFDRWWQRRHVVDVDGCRMDTPSAEDVMIVLAVQVAKDAATGMLRLAKIYDLAYLTTNARPLNWTAVAEEATRLRVRGMLGFALGVTTTLLRLRPPDEVAAIARLTPRLRRLVAEEADEVFRDSEGGAPTTRRLVGFHWHVRESVRDRLWPYVAIPLAAAAPNEWDRAVIRLPPWLFGLYYFIRPVRLAWKYGRRHATRGVAADRTT